MVEAVRTTASTFGIWAIVAVAMLCLAAWLISVYVADSHQTTLSRQRRRMMTGAPGPALGEAETTASAATAAPAASVPGQRRAAGQPATATEPPTEPATGTQAAELAAPGKHARPEATFAASGSTAVGGRESDERDLGRQADAPTRPDLPAQEPAPTGRHAMPAQRSGESHAAGATQIGPQDARGGRPATPAQRSGDSDRAERSLAGSDPNRPEGEDEE